MPQTDIVILKALLNAKEAFVSGNSLANALGISRVGVWARLEKMREQGFSFEAVRHRGYRLVHEPLQLHDRLTRAYLDGNETRIKVLYEPEVDSTNSEAERQLAAGLGDPFVVLAGHQTKGRGRLGRTWHSPKDCNIYASFAFRPQMAPARMQTITLWLGLHLCDLLHRTYDLPIKLKWPNDLLVEDKKVAGMLTEARVDSDLTRDLVFGLGLNVNCRMENWPRDLQQRATTLQLASREPLRINKLAAELIGTVVEAYESFMKGGWQDELMRLWQEHDYLGGRPVKAVRGREEVEGKVIGITPDGSLQLETKSGDTVAISAGEVTVKY